jgi:hypothetical protein
MVDRPEDYRCSSYARYVRTGHVVGWVTYDQVLGEFGYDLTGARRAYSRFVRAGVTDPPPRPFAKVVGGLLLGSEGFVDRIRALLRERGEDAGLPERRQLRPRPAMARIVGEVSTHFGHDPDQWRQGRRVDDASRALAAYLARRRFGYSAREVAAAMEE